MHEAGDGHGHRFNCGVIREPVSSVANKSLLVAEPRDRTGTARASAPAARTDALETPQAPALGEGKTIWSILHPRWKVIEPAFTTCWLAPTPFQFVALDLLCIYRPSL